MTIFSSVLPSNRYPDIVVSVGFQARIDELNALETVGNRRIAEGARVAAGIFGDQIDTEAVVDVAECLIEDLNVAGRQTAQLLGCRI